VALTSAAVTTAINCGGKATVTIVATGGTASIQYTFNSTTNREFYSVSGNWTII
jgi:hypothetical protein